MKKFRILRFCLLALLAIVGIHVVSDPGFVDLVVDNARAIVASTNYSVIEGLGMSLAGAPLTIAFARDIEEQIFPNNEFYMRSRDDSMWVVNNEVKYPVEGQKPNVVINRQQFPAPVVRREDDENSYLLAEFTSDPTHLQYSEELVVNYAKRSSILRSHIETLNTKIADFFANIWYPNGTSNIVRTTGESRIAASMGATGNRKRIRKQDLIQAIEILNRMDAPNDGRNILIAPEHLSDLLLIDDFVHADKLGASSRLVEGSIGRILGCDVFMRSYTAAYDNSGTPVKKALGAAGASADNAAALVWSSSFVTRAKGSTKVFYDQDKPEMYGDVFSALVRAGGKTRKDKKGIVAIVEAHA